MFGEGFRFHYALDPSGSISQIVIHHYSKDVLSRFFSRYGIHWEVKQLCQNENELPHAILSKINRLQPILLTVGTNELHYHPAFKTISTNREHIITVTGIRNDEVSFADCFVPTLPRSSIYHGSLSINELAAACKLSNWKTYAIYYCGETKIEVHESDYLNMLRTNLKLHLGENMEKLLRFSNDIPHFVHFFSESEIRNNMKELFFYIKYNGIVASRRLLTEYIKKIRSMVPNLHFKQSDLDMLDQHSKKWDSVAYFLLKCGISDPISHSPFQQASEKIKRVIADEENLFHDLLLKAG